jgi:lysozyme
MKKGVKIVIITLIIIAIVLVTIFFTVFILAKQKKLFINKWFVDEKNSTIGVDVSSYQADIDMNKLKEQNIKFIYIKATEGSKTKDNRFDENWENAENAELLSGAYHFFSFDSEGRTQAENCISAVGEDITGRLIPVVDVEYYGDKEQNPPNKEDVVRELKVFLEMLEEEYGVKPLIYTGFNIYDNYLKGEFDEYSKWISSFYTPISWNYKDDWYIWQYLNRGELEGYTGGEKYIDLNVLNKDKKIEDLIVK